VALHILYNLWAKNVVILDVFFIAFGFQIRIWVGSLAIGGMPSEWLQMCVFVLSLFLGFTKRRSELSALKEKAVEHRQALLEYNLYLLDQIIMITSTLTVVFYGLYTISQDIMTRLGNYHMVYSLGFVIFGVFRYLYLVHVKKLGDEPGELILRDIPMIINLVLWLGYIWLIFYL
jgi:4-hydroxybenzoate polyprenyltransferase